MTIIITKFRDSVIVECPLIENGVLIEGRTERDVVRPGQFWGDSVRGKGRPYGWLLARVGQTVELEDM